MNGETTAGQANSRNGYGQKTVLTDTGRLALDIPRDRQGTFDPQLIAKYQRRFPGFDEKIVSMYAVRPDGADHQWRRVPPRELSIALVADERFGRVTGWIEAS